jgi:hypothetical protein
MKMTKLLYEASILSLAGLLSACSTIPRGQEITLQEAVVDSVKALTYAYNHTGRGKETWGLKPAEVTLVYNISNTKASEKGITLASAAPSLPVSIGAKLGLTDTTVRGNTVTLRFTQDGKK